MTAMVEDPASGVSRYRPTLMISIMVLISSMTGLTLYVTQRNLAENVEKNLEAQFQAELDRLHSVQDQRHGALLERCRVLVRRSRIRAALEDDAMDLLYLSAHDELRDLRQPVTPDIQDNRETGLRAEFYRFLDARGAVIPPPNDEQVGRLDAADERQLALSKTLARQQLGYLFRQSGSGEIAASELIAMPIFSDETGETIAALVLGFRPFQFGQSDQSLKIESGIWQNGPLFMPGLSRTARDQVQAALSKPRVDLVTTTVESSFRISVNGEPHLLFYKRLNPDSLFPPAEEVCLYSLSDLTARQAELRRQVLGGGGILLLAGIAASYALAGSFAKPYEKLASDKTEEQVGRARAETALEATSKELQRSARFSANASHQLKTPVTVLRAGLEELLRKENLDPAECEEISALVHQTYRLNSIIEDLLLLSQIDAGRLHLKLGPVRLAPLVEAWIDDLSALPDPNELTVDHQITTDLLVAGEAGYTSLILQNLLENARKYNRAGGRVVITAIQDESDVRLRIGNTGMSIPADTQGLIFERFHRGTAGENVPGHGLGLNLARELARLHHGDLRLVKSELDWTEFELRLLRSAGAKA